jgi:hypothetical protein
MTLKVKIILKLTNVMVSTTLTLRSTTVSYVVH